MRPKSRYHALFRISFRKSISPRRAARPPLPRADADDRARRPLASRRRTAFVVMSFSVINFDALRASLVAVPRHRQRPFHDEPPPRPVTAARKMRGKETIDHLYDMLYPKSLVAGNKGTPVSVQAGVRRRARASRERERRTSCPVHATPRECTRATPPPPPPTPPSTDITMPSDPPTATKTARSTTSYASRSPRTTCASSISGTSRSERRRASPPAVKREPSTDGRRIGRDERGRRRASSGGTYF